MDATSLVSAEWCALFARRWQDAWNSRDTDRVLGLMTEDVTHVDDACPAVIRGRRDAREYVEARWRRWPELWFELVSPPYVATDRDSAALHWRMRGRRAGSSPGGGATVRLDGVDIHHYQDERVCHIRGVLNVQSIVDQIREGQ